MTRQEIKHPDRKSYTGGYADAVVLDNWVCVSGQGPIDLATGRVIHGSIEEETLCTLENVAAILKETGCTKADVVRCRCFLADIADFELFDKAFSEFFNGIRPARTTVQAGLGLGIKIEIDADARICKTS
jgi:Putative translation initiation inhibitor, yjgF family